MAVCVALTANSCKKEGDTSSADSVETAPSPTASVAAPSLAAANATGPITKEEAGAFQKDALAIMAAPVNLDPAKISLKKNTAALGNISIAASGASLSNNIDDSSNAPVSNFNVVMQGQIGTISIPVNRAVVVVVENNNSDTDLDALMEYLGITSVDAALLQLAMGKTENIIELIDVNASKINYVKLLKGMTIDLKTANGGTQPFKLPATITELDQIIMVHGSENGMIMNGNITLTKNEMHAVVYSKPQRLFAAMSCYGKRWVDGIYKKYDGTIKPNAPKLVQAHWQEINWVPIPFMQYFLYYFTGKGINIASMVGDRLGGFLGSVAKSVLQAMSKNGHKYDGSTYIDNPVNPQKRPFAVAVNDAFESSKIMMVQIYYFAFLANQTGSGPLRWRGDSASEIQLCSTAAHPELGCLPDNNSTSPLTAAFLKSVYRMRVSRPTIRLAEQKYLAMNYDGSFSSPVGNYTWTLSKYETSPVAALASMKSSAISHSIVESDIACAMENYALWYACHTKYPWYEEYKCADEFTNMVGCGASFLVDLLF